MKISESYLAKALKLSYTETVNLLRHLQQLHVLHYEPAKDKPQLTFVIARQDAAHLPVDRERMEGRKQLIMGKVKAIVEYVTTTHRCRMQLMQEYFNEDTDQRCGICDVCISLRKSENVQVFDELRSEVLAVLNTGSLTVEALEERIAPRDHELFVDVVREMVDEGQLVYDKTWRLEIAKTKT